MKKLIIVLVIIVGVVFVVLVLGPFYTVKEGEQAVVVRFGRIVQVQTGRRSGFQRRRISSSGSTPPRDGE
jgi:regulator of protease activity HflC (stomatin/prohibitin superfamily)